MLSANSERETLLSYFSHFSMGKIPSVVFFLRRWMLLIIITKKQTCIQTCSDDDDDKEKGQRWEFFIMSFFVAEQQRKMKGIFSTKVEYIWKGFDIVKKTVVCMLNYQLTATMSKFPNQFGVKKWFVKGRSQGILK